MSILSPTYCKELAAEAAQRFDTIEGRAVFITDATGGALSPHAKLPKGCSGPNTTKFDPWQEALTKAKIGRPGRDFTQRDEFRDWVCSFARYGLSQRVDRSQGVRPGLAQPRLKACAGPPTGTKVMDRIKRQPPLQHGGVCCVGAM